MSTISRAEQSKLNGAKSRGPVTESGKSISSRNSMTHGMTAETYLLPNESPELIQDKLDLFHDALQPQSGDEAYLVERLAVNAVKLDRIERAQTEILSEQVRFAEQQWDGDRKSKLFNLIELRSTDPKRALQGLESFGLGILWLLERWDSMKQAFDGSGCWNSFGLILDVLRLSGWDPIDLESQPLEAYRVAQYAIASFPSDLVTEEMNTYLATKVPDEWMGRFKLDSVPCPTAQKELRIFIHHQITQLRQKLAILQPLEKASREGANVRAMAPLDTPQNRLILRYTKASESTLMKTMNDLKKMQANRQKQAENEVKNAEREALKEEKRNEPKVSSKSLKVGTCVTLASKTFLISDATEQYMLLERTLDMPVMASKEVVPTPETVV